MIEENKRPKTKSLLLEMWAMANRSRAIRGMMDTFYGGCAAGSRPCWRRSTPP